MGVANKKLFFGGAQGWQHALLLLLRAVPPRLMKGVSPMEQVPSTPYEAPVLSDLGTLSELTMGSSLNVAGDALLQAAASIIHIEL
jgi:hypothetical protein